MHDQVVTLDIPKNWQPHIIPAEEANDGTLPGSEPYTWFVRRVGPWRLEVFPPEPAWHAKGLRSALRNLRLPEEHWNVAELDHVDENYLHRLYRTNLEQEPLAVRLEVIGQNRPWPPDSAEDDPDHDDDWDEDEEDDEEDIAF